MKIYRISYKPFVQYAVELETAERIQHEINDRLMRSKPLVEKDYLDLIDIEEIEFNESEICRMLNHASDLACQCRWIGNRKKNFLRSADKEIFLDMADAVLGHFDDGW